MRTVPDLERKGVFYSAAADGFMLCTAFCKENDGIWSLTSSTVSMSMPYCGEGQDNDCIDAVSS